MDALLHNPGLLYVLATLVPLASFVILFLGGRRLGRAGAFIATGAIATSCVLSLVGLFAYLSSRDTSHGHGGAQGHGHAAAHGHDAMAGPAAHGHKADAKGHAAASRDHAEKPPWQGSMYWAVIHFKDAREPAVALKLGYYIDGLAVTMFTMVTFIATLIHLFSMGYMKEELQETVEDHQAHVSRKGRFSRFFMFLSLFCFSMLNLILADNLFQIFVSWELVGICSFLLIGFYYERRSASTAANKAFITNRVGDAGFIIGLLIAWTSLGTLNFYSTKDAEGNIKDIGIFDVLRSPAADHDGAAMPTPGQITRVTRVKLADGEGWQVDPNGSEVLLFTRDFRRHFHAGDFEAATKEPDHGVEFYPSMPYWLVVLAGIGIFMGCVGKSAQFPLQVWLPDAMEGPTPVSALIHAATMVAAGVYLVGRAYMMFTADVLLIIAYVGAITLFVAATIALVQTDIKKVLAYSTVSQLGFMMLALGVGGWVAGLFHLITHAFFKALLFLGSGSVIHGCHHEQEMTKMGGLYAKMKITALTMLVGVFAIAGTPLFSGWYSKDAMLVAALSFVSLNPKHMLLFLLPLMTAGMTSFYMWRLWLMTFAGKPRDEHVHEHAHESPWIMTVPLIILAFFSLTVAWGRNPLDIQGSALEQFLHEGVPASLEVDTGNHLKVVASQAAPTIHGGNYFAADSWLYPIFRDQLNIGPHDLAGILALLVGTIGLVLALVVYGFRYLDPAETKQQFASVFHFLWNKWYFDELYRHAVVRPGIIVAGWCRWFDATVIDGLINWLARMTVRISRWDGRFDLGVIDGLVNLTGNVVFGVGSWLRVFQTGLIRNYVLFLALAAVGIFAVLSYVVALAG